MNMMIRPVIPDISNFSFDNWLAIANIFILIAFAVLAAYATVKKCMKLCLPTKNALTQ